MYKRLFSVFIIVMMVITAVPALGFAGAEGGTEPDAALMEVSGAVASEELTATGTEVSAAGMIEAAASGDSDTIQLANNAVFSPDNINTGSAKGYVTEAVSNSSSYTSRITSDVYVNMPKKGTLLIGYKVEGNCSDCLLNVSSTLASYRGSVTNSGVKVFVYAVSGPGKIRLSFDQYVEAYGNAYVRFTGIYAPCAANAINASASKWTEYYFGSAASTGGTSSFSVNAPGKGYLILQLGDGLYGSYAVQMKTKGFKDYEYVSSSDNTRYIGVKKGTYTFSIKTNTEIYGAKVKYVKVSENKYGAKKKKAAKVKRKKKVNGLIVTDAKKPHWYKIKVGKGKKQVKITLDTHLSGGGSYGGLKITAYKGKKNIGSGTVYAGALHKEFKISPVLGNKLKKGTYYIKIQSYKGGTGQYTFKWK